MRRICITLLLLSGLYTDAAAQSWDQVLPDGSVIHRRVFTYPQCIGADRAAHDRPCKPTDIGFIDRQRKVHLRGYIPDALGALLLVGTHAPMVISREAIAQLRAYRPRRHA